MDVGVVRETKEDERRVALTPAGTRELVERGHTVWVEAGAGRGAGFSDERYAAAGAKVTDGPAEVYDRATLLVHVKEPQPDELRLLGPDHVLFTYLHLAAYPDVAAALVSSGATAIAYETVAMPDGSLPLLAPMSHIAGRLSVQAGAHHLTAPGGGKGTLLGGYPGVPPANVTVLGAGSAGLNAVDVAVGMGARVTVLDIDPAKLARVVERWQTRVITEFSTSEAVSERVAEADLVIGAVLVTGARAPILVDRADLARMTGGSVVVDISIDQGGCLETSRETTLHDPTYVVDGVVHYAVGNIPGAVPETATKALCNTTLPYVIALAGGIDAAITRYPELSAGINISDGEVINSSVAQALQAAS